MKQNKSLLPKNADSCRRRPGDETGRRACSWNASVRKRVGFEGVKCRHARLASTRVSQRTVGWQSSSRADRLSLGQLSQGNLYCSYPLLLNGHEKSFSTLASQAGAGRSRFTGGMRWQTGPAQGLARDGTGSDRGGAGRVARVSSLWPFGVSGRDFWGKAAIWPLGTELPCPSDPCGNQ